MCGVSVSTGGAGGSLSRIDATAAIGAPSVAPPVGADSVTEKDSADSAVLSLTIGIETMRLDASPDPNETTELVPT